MDILHMNKGKMIAFSGLSGCGKSTLAKLVANQMKIVSCNEPEEHEWPELIRYTEKYGHANAMIAFRQMWAKLFIDASLLAKEQELIFIDTYFFKLFGYYLGKPGMDWLVPSNDPYLEHLKALNKLDRDLASDVDCVVLFDVSLHDWKQFLKARGRDWDKRPGFEESYALTQRYVREATIEHCKEKSIPIVEFNHEFGDPEEQGLRLRESLGL